MHTSNTTFALTPIGIIHSPLKQLEDCPLQEQEGAPEAKLEIRPDFQPGLLNLAVGQQLILLTWFHQADRNVLQCYPRRDAQLPPTGVFATRSPDRPNPIGLHHVTITHIGEDGMISVHPLEALDGTPVIDIKPVLGQRS